MLIVSFEAAACDYETWADMQHVLYVTLLLSEVNGFTGAERMV